MAENEKHILKIIGTKDHPHSATITIDGKELRHVKSISLGMAANKPPIATFEIYPGMVHIEGEFEVVFTKPKE
jgi:hypothetical protein